MSACTIDQLAVGCLDETETWKWNGDTYTKYTTRSDYLIDWWGDSVHSFTVNSANPTIIELVYGNNCDAAHCDISTEDNDLAMFKLERIL